METTAVPAARVKQEPRADDDEINQLAARMVEQHRQKAAQQLLQQQQLQAQRPQQHQLRQRPAGQTNITSFFATARDGSQGKRGSADLASQLLDTDSVRMRFGWSVVGQHPLPCLFRKGERFCPVRAVEKMLLSLYLQKLPMDVCNCTSIKSYFVTENEAKLLNEINYRHCEYFYGREAFTPKDCIVRVDDARQFADFLALCERKMVNMQSKPDDRCGFLRINGESVVPFTIKRVTVNGEKRDVRFVPLFYFEGETEHLKHKAEQLTGWDLAYLKLCCKVQGIRSELFQSDTCDVVSLDDVKRHFPSGTQFQTWWPIKRFEFKLTNQPKPSFWECQPPPSSSQVTPVSATAGRVTVSRQTTATPVASAAAPPASRSQMAQWASGRLGSAAVQQRTPAAATASSNTTYGQLLLTNGVPITSVLTAVNGQLRQSSLSQSASGAPRLSGQSSLPPAYQTALTPQLLAQMQQQMSVYSSPSVVRQEGILSSGAPPRSASAASNGRQAPPLLPMSAAKRAAPSGEPPRPVDLSRTALDGTRLLQMPRSQFRSPVSNLDPFIAQKTGAPGDSEPGWRAGAGRQNRWAGAAHRSAHLHAADHVHVL
ncbi:uncharacterized protein LOC122369262 isoform X2 [Amphibalanus amphitrite]|uniref:uncharacterized protein LOC122369262 isoform X2 n=1 Tax=Amphibalanus amphitrite TaxID=1232801 RepID=UPI001C92534A|nr:uncharacterized protein LOC122369262 isoform X2 [Amphibalanus amphitrite]XP_043199800.1 uncharacterized protein LOC122369262 isoform X2 [Amphibalanus amphitrite]XP_043199801.1 uncharacterized protein LOC122369262 isoform X2 [Amphibalanus amphitrite]XP_043199802.1 uncharacterized protein LOC122369262 isoform X2 [Amphibalanus amphitrite]